MGGTAEGGWGERQERCVFGLIDPRSGNGTNFTDSSVACWMGC